MIKQIVSASVGVAIWAVVAAEGVRSQTELVGSVEFAPYATFQRKVADLGATINNPLVPMMISPGVQSTLTETFGKFRSDAPMKFLCYADVAAIRKALANDADDSIEDAIEYAFLYPCAEGPDAFMASHPDAKKKPDGSIELDDGDVVVFAADGRTCAFANGVAVAKRALATPLAAGAAYPIFRLDVTDAGLGILADVHQKKVVEQAPVTTGTNTTEVLLASFARFQQKQARRQNAILRTFAQMNLVMDLDETGLVVKGGVTAKPGCPASPVAGFRLPAGALDAVPAGAPLFLAGNPLVSSDIQNEADYRELLGDVRTLSDNLFACFKQKSPEYAQLSDDLRAAVSDLLTSVPYPAPTDWSTAALAFGPKQQPYLVQAGTCAQASQVIAVSTRFYAAVAAAIGKKWPGILTANGAGFSVDWFRLIDTVAAEAGATQAEQKEVETAKKTVADIVGGTASEATTVQPTPTSYRTLVAAKGFAVPSAASEAERRFAAALPEVAADRSSTAFYLSLYSLLRDNVLPLVLKASPKKENLAEVKAIVDELPPAGANSAIAGSVWYGKDGSCRFLLRVTKDEIRNFGAAANAVMAASASKGDGGNDDDK